MKILVEVDGKLDVVLFICVLYNFNCFSVGEIDYMGDMLVEIYWILKLGGIVGVVQYSVLDVNNDDWVNGFNGYLKILVVVVVFEVVGFEFEVLSDVNVNLVDVLSEEDFVWCLLLIFVGIEEGMFECDVNVVIGEFNWMMLKFCKFV